MTISPSVRRFCQFAGFLLLCGVVIAVWVAGLALGASDRFVSTGAGVMSAVTLILVALLKNAELRAERAIQRKLDAIARALVEQQRGDQASSTRELEDTIGVHESDPQRLANSSGAATCATRGPIRTKHPLCRPPRRAVRASASVAV